MMDQYQLSANVPSTSVATNPQQLRSAAARAVAIQPARSGRKASYVLRLASPQGDPVPHKDEEDIEVLSFAWGVHVPRSTFTAIIPSGNPMVNAFSFTHAIDRSSPALFFCCVAGKHIPTATFHLRDANGFLFATYKFSDVFVSSISPGGDAQGTTENVTLAFTKVQVTFVPKEVDGTPSEPILTGWDFEANK